MMNGSDRNRLLSCDNQTDNIDNDNDTNNSHRLVMAENNRIIATTAVH